MYPGIHAQAHPQRPAVIMAGSGRSVTYAELEANSSRLANWLRAQGVRRGDVIALLAENDPRVFEVYWAAQRCGLYLTAINYRLTPAELDYILDNSGAKVLFVSAAAMAAAGGIGRHDALVARVAFDGGAGFLDHASLLRQSSEDKPAFEPRGGDMLYSSGTTGRPKGVKPPLPERAVGDPGDTMVAMFGKYFGLDERTVYLSPAPLYHSAPLRTCATVQAVGGTAVVMERFDPEAALAAIERYRVTHSQWVPTMFIRMLKLPETVRRRYDLASLKVAIHAAAPCPVEVKRQMFAWWGPVLHEYYSATELNGLTVIAPQEWSRKPGSVGKPVLGTLHICDESGVEQPAGEVGTIYFERDVMPFAYHQDPEKTRATQHPLHPTWTTVGDIGYVDADGYLYLTDRKAFMIISGGVNVYPQEVENVLAPHPLVDDVAVIGVPDEEMGEEVKAVVQLVPGVAGSDAIADELIAFARRHLASYKVPRSVDFVDALPRSPVGKLLKGELVRRYRANAR